MDAIRIIEEARTQQIRLLGFDAAWVRPAGTQPSMNDSWDYSGRAWPAVEDPYEHARLFILQRAQSDLVFEIALDD